MSVSADTLDRQDRASDPRASVFVAANAGSGKTHVLTRRVVRLLLSGVAPNKILCLTYTKAAAAEMQGRVFSLLATWTRLSPQALDAELAGFGAIDDEGRARARQLFARALETPGGLKIQTIHAFCEAILHQFPIEANVPGRFAVLDEAQAAILVAEARRRLLTASHRAAEPDAALSQAFGDILAYGGESGLDRLVGEIVQRRDRITGHLAEAGGLEPALDRLAAALGLAPDADEESLLADLAEPDGFDAAFRQSLRVVAAASQAVTDRKLVGKLDAFAAAETGSGRLAALRSICLKADGERYKPTSIATKGVSEFFEDFAERLEALAMAVEAASERLATLRVYRASRAALTLAERLEADYRQLKRRTGRLDFEDLVVRTADLLTREEAAAWVHYKLDQGIDHVLVDEAQDTSPRQWEVVRSLVDEFFVERAEDRGRHRTVFAVGDEKQSIYSFQGASPAMFFEQRREVEKRAGGIGAKFDPVNLSQSFRSVPAVLKAVDDHFARAEERRGLSVEDLPTVHESARPDAPGLVEIWPPVLPEPRLERDDWLQPIDAEPEASPANRLARRIAARIGGFLGTAIGSRNGPRAMGGGDVVILVRKRSGFVAAMGAALKAAGIPVAGADRLVITDHIAVQDLMALGRVVSNAEDELSLASLLKSPLFGFTDADLMALALGREGSLYRALRRATSDQAKAAFTRLEALRDRAGFTGIFEFYARLLGPEGGRAALSARLGPDTPEVVDAFLDLALAKESEGVSGLDAFLADLAANPPTVRREMSEAAGAVRIMTVHAAKGLEAPVVFLVDPGSAPFSDTHGARLMEWEDMPGLVPGMRPGWLWCPEKSLRNAVVERLRDREKDSAADEYRRLLYVGMTRAADRLILCGFAGSRGASDESWLARVTGSLAASATRIEDADGRLLAHRIGEEPVPFAGGAATAEPAAPRILSFSPLPPEPPLPRPLSPSAAGRLTIGSEENEEELPPPALADAEAMRRAARRGTLVHRLLQALPDIAPEKREQRARRYADLSVGEESDASRAALVARCLQILDDPQFAPLFAPGSRAEVAITGEVELGGTRWRVNGTVDRIAVEPTRILLVDYKTNRPGPAALEDVPRSHVLQLALYRAVLQPLYPGRRVAAALLYTEGPRLIALPEAVMDAALHVDAGSDTATGA